METRPCDKKATKEVRELLEYFNRIEGRQIITGQHTQTKKMEEVARIEEVTGKKPALCGFELLAYSPNIKRETGDTDCLTEIDAATGTMEEALAWGESGGLVTLTWHWFSPIGGWDKSFYSKNTDFDAEKVLSEGTEERKAFFNDMSIMAEILREFQNRNIPVLWRPFHEAEGDCFWWSKKGADVVKGLWTLMFNFYTNEKNLHNLVWVWNCPKKEYYVGDEYCDILTRDLYPKPHNHTSLKKEYDELKEITKTKGIALAETGVIPDPDASIKENAPWLWYMTWSRDFTLTENHNSYEFLKNLYNNDSVVTFDRIKRN